MTQDLQKVLRNALRASARMPMFFIGHGNPMNAILDNDITQNWSRYGKNIQQDELQAIVVISAHWLTEGTRITSAPTQPLIYDMYGFPDELYNVKYDANGDPEIAEQLREAFLEYEAKLDSTWGLDHGTWSILKHMAPEPHVPVLQISLDVHQSREKLVEMFAYMRQFREKGVVFIGSGNIVHNLSRIDFSGHTPDWAQEFDVLSAEAITNRNIKNLVKPERISSSALLAVPTDDHYRPMLAVMAMLFDDEWVDFFNETIDMGAASMRSFITQT